MPYQPAVLGTARLNNFRLNYLTPAQTAERPARIWIILGGVDISAPTSPIRVFYNSITIRDLVFDTPNTCQLTFYGAAPTLGQRLEIWANRDEPALLFGGELQTVDRTYKGRPTTVIHPCTAIDDTARANRRRPLGLWTDTSATTIAEWLIFGYAPGFSSAGVERNLPPISITFDGSEGGMKGCLTAVAKLIGGYWYFENRVLYLFITPPGPAPDPINDTPSRFLHDPQIRYSIDKSQVRTRVYGKGAGTIIPHTINFLNTLMPVGDASLFNPAGGRAQLGTTADGPAWWPTTYAGTQLGGGGGLVGPGAAPSSAPGLALASGAGVETGPHGYAITFTTAAGESLPSPIASITVGQVTTPATAPTPSAPTAGGSIEPGTYQYGVTFVTAAGETTISPASAPVTTRVEATVTYVAPPVTPTNTIVTGDYTPGWSVGDVITYRVVFWTATGETTGSPLSPGVVGVAGSTIGGITYMNACRVGLPISPDPSVVGRRFYRYRNGAIVGARDVAGNTATFYLDYSNVQYPGLVPPATNTATVPGPGAPFQTVALTQIPTGPPLVTARRIYRSPSWKLVDTIANNTATTYTDTKAAASLGAVAPGTNTAAANQVQMTIAIGGGSVTGRKLYRTAANQAPLQLLTTIANNTATTHLDAAGDGTLGAAPPGSDTSGLTQPSGQVLPGASSIVVANTSAFLPAPGGWAVVGNGEQVIRYTDKTATSLTGIPAYGTPGALVAAVSYNSTITASPALVGVGDLPVLILKNSPIHVWVQRDDPAAQAYMASIDGAGDGIYEHIVSDERRSEASLMQVCDAELELYSRPLVTVTYASRDTKTKSGKTVSIALASPAVAESLVIQDVAISEIGIAKTLKPKFTVTASSVRHSFDAILRMLIRKAGA